jgi:hypothetical protein
MKGEMEGRERREGKEREGKREDGKREGRGKKLKKLKIWGTTMRRGREKMDREKTEKMERREGQRGIEDLNQDKLARMWRTEEYTCTPGLDNTTSARTVS